MLRDNGGLPEKEPTIRITYQENINKFLEKPKQKYGGSKDPLAYELPKQRKEKRRQIRVLVAGFEESTDLEYEISKELEDMEFVGVEMKVDIIKYLLDTQKYDFLIVKGYTDFFNEDKILRKKNVDLTRLGFICKRPASPFLIVYRPVDKLSAEINNAIMAYSNKEIGMILREYSQINT